MGRGSPQSGRHAQRLAGTLLTVAAWIFAAAAPACAHGFGQRYDLPLPLPLYLFGAAAVVALSFVVFGLFVRHSRRAHDLFPTSTSRPRPSAV